MALNRDDLPFLAIGLSRTRFFMLVTCASVAGVVGEMLHLQAGVWVPMRAIGSFWWIFPVYFVGLILAGRFFLEVERRVRQKPALSRSALAIEVCCFLALFWMPPLLHTHELVLTVIAVAYLALRLLLFRKAGDLVVAAFSVVADLTIESSLVVLGVYHYPNSEWVAVPLWLGPLWGGLGLGIRRFLLATAVADRKALEQ
jgi:hypothetical protein